MAVAVIACVVALSGAGVAPRFAMAFPDAGPVVPFGTRVPLDVGNDGVIAYTVSNFTRSTDDVEAFRVGHLWEATLTVESLRGTATPVLVFFNARARNGRQYRILFQAYAQAAIKPDPVPKGAISTGKIYFDCNGTPPEMVVYNDGGRDLITWQ